MDLTHTACLPKIYSWILGRPKLDLNWCIGCIHELWLLMPARWDLRGCNQLYSWALCLSVGAAWMLECVESAVAVMRQGSWWPVWLTGQRPKVMWWGAGTVRSSPSLLGMFTWIWSKRSVGQCCFELRYIVTTYCSQQQRWCHTAMSTTTNINNDYINIWLQLTIIFFIE